jgi:23S rRNA (guanosine2251-2'-O)-methyltransferase
VTLSAELVYGRRAVREALRGRREVLELFVSARGRREPWLEGRRVHVRPERELSELAGTRDHQGLVARCEPYRYVDAYELASAERALLACLDQVTDPRNLGAVCRSAEGAGATGVLLPAHRSARVTPAVCRASAGAVEHLPIAVVPNLARWLNEVKSPSLWVYAAALDGEPLWEADLGGGLVLVFGAEGKGIRPLVRKACDAAVSIPLGGKVESLNVSVAAAVLLYEARRQRGEGTGPRGFDAVAGGEHRA